MIIQPLLADPKPSSIQTCLIAETDQMLALAGVQDTQGKLPNAMPRNSTVWTFKDRSRNISNIKVAFQLQSASEVHKQCLLNRMNIASVTNMIQNFKTTKGPNTRDSFQRKTIAPI